jgi:hypothetical protein
VIIVIKSMSQMNAILKEDGDYVVLNRVRHRNEKNHVRVIIQKESKQITSGGYYGMIIRSIKVQMKHEESLMRIMIPEIANIGITPLMACLEMEINYKS